MNVETLFDVDFGVGESGQRYPATPTADAALGVMDRYGIGRALVYDRGAMEAGHVADWTRLLGFCAAGPGRLFPTVSVLPPATGEQPPPEELVGMLIDVGIRAVRAWPEQHAFDFDAFSFAPLLEALAPRRIPVLVHMSEQHAWTRREGWRGVREAALAFPCLPIVLIGSGMRDGRRLFPLLDGCPNVLADLTCVTFQFVEFVVRRWGAGRLVYASHYPRLDPGLTAPMVLYAGIGIEERAAIGEGNLSACI